MRYIATDKSVKNAEPSTIDVEALGNNHYAVTMDGEKFELESLVLPTLPRGAVSLLINGHSHSMDITQADDELVHVTINGLPIHVDVADERRMRLRSIAPEHSKEGKQILCAPMPGKVVRLLAAIGEEVKEGQGIIVVEAMKMENELKSPKDGKVVEIFTKEGMAVDMNAKLVAVE
jgi:biotin carboxyl carrier protein